MSETILITGASGLIGAAVARAFIDSGYGVVGIDLAEAAPFRDDNFQYVQHDIVDDGTAALLDEVGPGAVIHCAAHPGGKSLQEPVDNVRVNLTGSMRLFEWAARNGKRVHA